MNKSNNGVFTERLKKARLEKNLYMRDMADRLNYNSTSSYLNIEKGKVQPTIEQINKISKILDGKVEYFFDLDVQENQTN